MKLLHTGDWHLGKKLEGHSRLEEQQRFLNDFIQLAEREKVDLILIAGDVYDKPNPPAEAEKLFYDTVKQLSRGGECIVLVIAGNHDSPDRLSAVTPIAMSHGIIIIGKPKTIIPVGAYGKHTVLESGEGYIKLRIHNETAVILAVPYLSEKRLNEVLYKDTEDDIKRIKSYNDRMKQLFETLGKQYQKDTINLIVSHLYTLGSEESGSERSIQLGGSYSFDAQYFPKEAQYIALGHIHKPQIVQGTNKQARYAGSPLHYNKKEIGYQKICLLIDVVAGEAPLIQEISIPIYKPIEVWKCKSIEDAMKQCEQKKNEVSYVYMEVQTDRYIKEDELKQMKSLKADILEVLPKLPVEDETHLVLESYVEQDIVSSFKAFYKKERQLDVDEEVLEAFLKLTMEREEDDATDSVNSEGTQ